MWKWRGGLTEDVLQDLPLGINIHCFVFFLPNCQIFFSSRLCSLSLQELHIKNKHIVCSHIHIYIQWWCPHECKVGSTFMYDIYIYYKPIQINGLTENVNQLFLPLLQCWGGQTCWKHLRTLTILTTFMFPSPLV